MGCCKAGLPLDPTKLTGPEHRADGTIAFPTTYEVPIVEGYDKVEVNGQIHLIPQADFPVCPKRITGIMLMRDKTYKLHHVCNHKKCPKKGQDVSISDCRDCPFKIASGESIPLQ